MIYHNITDKSCLKYLFYFFNNISAILKIGAKSSFFSLLKNIYKAKKNTS